MKIKYSKKSLKFLAKQDNSTVARIKNAIEKLTHKPPELFIDEIGNRGDIYK